MKEPWKTIVLTAVPLMVVILVLAYLTQGTQKNKCVMEIIVKHKDGVTTTTTNCVDEKEK